MTDSTERIKREALWKHRPFAIFVDQCQFTEKEQVALIRDHSALRVLLVITGKSLVFFIHLTSVCFCRALFVRLSAAKRGGRKESLTCRHRSHWGGPPHLPHWHDLVRYALCLYAVESYFFLILEINFRKSCNYGSQDQAKVGLKSIPLLVPSPGLFSQRMYHSGGSRFIRKKQNRVHLKNKNSYCWILN